MRYRLTLMTVAALMAVQTIDAQSVFSPSVNGLRSRYQTQRAATRNADNLRVAVVVTCSYEASMAEIANKMKEHGAVIRVVMDNQIVADLPMASLDALAGIKGILLVDCPKGGTVKTDIVRKVSHVDEAHAGKMTGAADLPQAYTGKGVIIGVIDRGFDYTHPMFKDKEGNLRIKGVYQPGVVDAGHTKYGEDLSNISTINYKGEAVPATLTGSYYTKPDVILDTTIVKDDVSNHGTHCASIAAGTPVDYTSTFTAKYKDSGKLGGMAPEADLILSEVKITEDESKLFAKGFDLSALNRIQAYSALRHFADKAGKPLVISSSQNSHCGFHDGTSSIARFLGNYGKKEGNVVALCSSNEGDDYSHLHKTIAKGGTAKIFYEYKTNSDAYFYLRTDKEIKVDLDIVDLDENEVFHTYNLDLTNSQKAESYRHSFTVVVTKDSYEGSDSHYEDIAKHIANNYIDSGKLDISIDLGTGLDKDLKDFTYTEICVSTDELKMAQKGNGKRPYLRILVSSPESDVEMLTWAEYANLYWNGEKGTADCSMGDWNTSGELISVGSYNADSRYLEYDAETQTLKWDDAATITNPIGRYTDFSSYGYDLSDAKRAYPDVVTPGFNIYAAGSSFFPAKDYLYADYTNQLKGQTGVRKYPYTTMSGTSMATPATAGILALWMQAAKEKGKPLTNAYMKEVLKNSCDNDDWTKASPINYGYGKMNAYKGLLYILDLTTAIPELPSAHIGVRLEGKTLYIDGYADEEVSIYNLAGQKILETRAAAGGIQLSALPAGVYAVKIGNQGSTLIRL